MRKSDLQIVYVLLLDRLRGEPELVGVYSDLEVAKFVQKEFAGHRYITTIWRAELNDTMISGKEAENDL